MPSFGGSDSKEEVEKLANYAYISLNGTNKQVLESYIKAIVQYRLWNMQRGICVDVSSILQQYPMLYTTAPDNSFHFIVQYGNDTIDLVFDAKSAWFEGVVKKDWSFQFWGSTYLKQCKHVEFTGLYSDIAPGDDVGNIPMGLPSLIQAFRMTHSYNGESSEAFRKSLGTWILYFGEAPKFHSLFRACSRSIKDDNIVSLYSHGGNMGVMVRYWGKLCSIGMKYLVKALHGSEIPPLDKPLQEIQKVGLTGINTLQDIIENICIWTYTSPAYRSSKSQRKAMESPSQTVFSPIETVFSQTDSTNDAYEKKIVKHFRQLMYALSNEKSEEKESETNTQNMNGDVDENIGGHGASTIRHRAAESFVERQRMLFCAKSWSGDRRIKESHLGFCLRQTNIQNPSRLPKSSILTAVMKTRRFFSTLSRYLRP